MTNRLKIKVKRSILFSRAFSGLNLAWIFQVGGGASAWIHMHRRDPSLLYGKWERCADRQSSHGSQNWWLSDHRWSGKAFQQRDSTHDPGTKRSLSFQLPWRDRSEIRHFIEVQLFQRADPIWEQPLTVESSRSYRSESGKQRPKLVCRSKECFPSFMYSQLDW